MYYTKLTCFALNSGLIKYLLPLKTDDTILINRDERPYPFPKEAITRLIVVNGPFIDWQYCHKQQYANCVSNIALIGTITDIW